MSDTPMYEPRMVRVVRDTAPPGIPGWYGARGLGFVGRAHPPKRGGTPFTCRATGCCVHPAGYVLTAWHAITGHLSDFSPYGIFPDVPIEARDVETGENPCFTFYQPIPPLQEPRDQVRFEALYMEGVELTAAPDLDLAVMRLNFPRRLMPAPFDKIASRPARIGERLHFLGQYSREKQDGGDWPNEFAVAHYLGNVVLVREHDFFLNGWIERGMSGGPVVNEAREIVGIMVERLWPEGAQRQFGTDRALVRAIRPEVCGHLLWKALSSTHPQENVIGNW